MGKGMRDSLGAQEKGIHHAVLLESELRVVIARTSDAVLAYGRSQVRRGFPFSSRMPAPLAFDSASAAMMNYRPEGHAVLTMEAVVVTKKPLWSGTRREFD